MKVILVYFLMFYNLTGADKMDIYSFEVLNIDKQKVSMSKYKGKVLLVVNVASECGYTNQYEGLQNLYAKHNKDGLEVLGFPSNQFLSQEPGTEDEIKNFCQTTFGVKFDMFAKVDVNGEDTIPLYKFLKEQKTGILTSESIKWNFTKFLVDRKGNVVKRYAPSTSPKEIEDEITSLLKK